MLGSCVSHTQHKVSTWYTVHVTAQHSAARLIQTVVGPFHWKLSEMEMEMFFEESYVRDSTAKIVLGLVSSFGARVSPKRV